MLSIWSVPYLIKSNMNPFDSIQNDKSHMRLLHAYTNGMHRDCTMHQKIRQTHRENQIKMQSENEKEKERRTGAERARKKAMRNKRNRFTCGLVAPGAISLSPNCVCASAFDGDGGGDYGGIRQRTIDQKEDANDGDGKVSAIFRCFLFDLYQHLAGASCTQHKSWTNHKLNASLPCAQQLAYAHMHANEYALTRTWKHERILLELKWKRCNAFIANRKNFFDFIWDWRSTAVATGNHHPLVSCCQLIPSRWLLLLLLLVHSFSL